MDLKEIAEQIKRVENPQSLYSIVTDNYGELSKETLMTIIRELDWSMFNTLTNMGYEMVKANFVERIEDIVKSESGEDEE